jgi:hypothetical protein
MVKPVIKSAIEPAIEPAIKPAIARIAAGLTKQRRTKQLTKKHQAGHARGTHSILENSMLENDSRKILENLRTGDKTAQRQSYQVPWALPRAVCGQFGRFGWWIPEDPKRVNVSISIPQTPKITDSC